MRQIPKLRPTLWDGAVALAVLLFAAALLLLLPRLGGGTEGMAAVVYIDGAEADRVEAAGQTLRRSYSGGGYTVQAEFDLEGGVRAVWADCPTQDCVRTGRISRRGESIVCLPARIVIRLEGGAAEAEAPDAVLR